MPPRSGPTTVWAGGDIRQGVTATGHVLAHAGGSIDGPITSSSGVVHVTAWGSASGSLSGARGVYASAYDGVQSPTATSSSGPVTISSLHNVNTDIDAADSAAVATMGQYHGSVLSHNADAVALAADGFQGKLTAPQDAVLLALKEVQAAMIAARMELIAETLLSKGIDAEKGVFLYVQKSVANRSAPAKALSTSTPDPSPPMSLPPRAAWPWKSTWTSTPRCEQPNGSSPACSAK